MNDQAYRELVTKTRLDTATEAEWNLYRAERDRRRGINAEKDETEKVRRLEADLAFERDYMENLRD